MKIRRYLYIFAIFLLFLLFNRTVFAEQSVADDHRTSKKVTYLLGAGDQLKIDVYNQLDLSGEYHISGTGVLSLPLIGIITAKGLTLNELENRIINKLSPDYLLNPRVSIQVLNYRPFYILGEVVDPKSYAYVDGMTYLHAIAIAGGFTYRAKESHVFVIHSSDHKQTEIKKQMDMRVIPGDIIRVDERLF